MNTTKSTANLEARISNELYSLQKEAAEHEGRTMTNFILSAAREAETIPLTLRDQQTFLTALLSPSEPTHTLRNAFVSRNKLIGIKL